MVYLIFLICSIALAWCVRDRIFCHRDRRRVKDGYQCNLSRKISFKHNRKDVTHRAVSSLRLRLSNLILEKAMAPHSSTLAWKIPWTEEPGRLQSMRSLRVGHDWPTSLSLFSFMHWRRKWQPTPVFLPGESQGQRSLIGGHLWGCTESDMTEVT